MVVKMKFELENGNWHCVLNHFGTKKLQIYVTLLFCILGWFWYIWQSLKKFESFNQHDSTKYSKVSKDNVRVTATSSMSVIWTLENVGSVVSFIFYCLVNVFTLILHHLLACPDPWA